jgi:hypothetical protein
MAEKIGFQSGIEATRQNLNKLDPNKSSYDKQARTLTTLVKGHNEFEDRLAALEAAAPAPFPFPGSSM